MSAGRPLSAGAIALMLMLCLSWGFNQIAVKLVIPDIPPFLQATIRSAGALLVILSIAWLRGVKLFERDGTLGAGLFAGVMFGIEFVLIYRGLLLTSASRAVVFLYTAPFFVALGSYRFLGERLRACNGAGSRYALPASRSRLAFPKPMSMPRYCWAICGGRRRRAVGRNHAGREDHATDHGARRKGAGLSGRDVDPDSGLCGLDLRRDHYPGSRPAGACR